MRHGMTTASGTILLAVSLCLSAAAPASAQEQTVGLFLIAEGADDGYTLFSPMQGSSTYLIDNEGLLIHEWQHVPATLFALFLEQGTIPPPGIDECGTDPTQDVLGCETPAEDCQSL